MEHKQTTYQPPKIFVSTMISAGRILNVSDNGEMHNGGFLDE